MADRYVRVTGDNGNDGLSPSSAWQTVQKAMESAAAGDVVWVGAGSYRLAIQPSAGSSPASEVQIRADISGAKTGDAGFAILTPYTTNDTTAPVGRALTLNGRSNFSFYGFTIMGGNNTSALWVDGDTGGAAQNIKFVNCVFLPGSTANATRGVRITCVVDVAANWEFDGCTFVTQGPSSTQGVIDVLIPTSSVADYDVNIQVKNCRFFQAFGDSCVYVASSGANSSRGGGVAVSHCLNVGNAGMMRTVGTSLSTTIPCTVTRSMSFSRGTALNAGASGQITEDYNILIAPTARTNVSAGANSKSDGSIAVLMEMGQWFYSGTAPQPFGTPLPGSPLLGFAPVGAATTDMLGRVRPAGGGSLNVAIGPLERHNTAVRETSVTDAGGVGAQITGPGDQDIEVPVNALSTTLSLRMRFDTDHGTTTRPQVKLLANPELGVAEETLTMTAAADTWETMTLSSFTPTAKGVVKLRVISRPAAASGKTFFDTVTGGAEGSQGLDFWSQGELFRAAVATGAGGGGSPEDTVTGSRFNRGFN